MKLRWTRTAAEDILAIHAFIAKNSATYADAVCERILSRPEQLLAHPLSGSIVPEYDRQDIREVFVHSFRLIYLVLDDEIQVLTVIHGARMPPTDPPTA